MPTITGTLTWETAPPHGEGWVLRSAAVQDGTSIFPGPSSIRTNALASEDLLRAMIQRTLEWEQIEDLLTVILEPHDQNYAWYALLLDPPPPL